MSQHLVGKEFWNETICFTNKDKNLTKAHVKYLETRLIEIILESKRYDLDNDKQPPTSSLPRGERDAMETFIENIRTVIGSLGYKLLEPKVYQITASLPREPKSMVFRLKVKKLDAKATLTDEGIVVLKGSQALTTVQPSLSKGYTKLRSNLEEIGTLMPSGDHLVATEDILFTSASQPRQFYLAILAAAPITGETLLVKR